MLNFLKYLLGLVIAAAIPGMLAAAVLGLPWGLGFVALFLLAVALRDAWRLQELHGWLHRHEAHAVPHPSGLWGQVFNQLYRLEKHSDQNQQKLRIALERFQLAGAALPNGVIVIDQADRILWCNPSAERHFGISLKQDRGQSLAYLIRNPEFLDHLKKPTPSEPLILRKVRGSDLVLSIEIVAFGEDERLLVSHDFTQVERDERIRQDFVANVSHELGTPITVIGGFIETLLEGEKLDAAMQQRILEMMREQAMRMQRLVEDLLSLSRLESQHTPPAPEPVSVSAMMRRQLQLARQLSQGRHDVEGTVEFDDAILGSETELASALGNLVTNAVRYTPDGGRITLSWEREGEGGVFRVSDTGIGIAKEHIPRLTERFYRVDRGRSRDTGGTGLGLAIVKQVVAHHGLRLQIASQPDQGSTFSIHVPASRLVKDNAPLAALDAE
jgi:two-component system phosphate regulon sensor histidine kinase PhoR